MSFVAMASTRASEMKKKAKSNTAAQLEVESRKMEERLRMLKEMMSAEKARREMEGGFLWESGQRGPLLRKQPSSTAVKATLVASTNSHHGQKRSKERIKVKILSEKNGACGSTLPESIRCGQCDSSTASLSCVECVENYCHLCYAKFHQKGALASHHAKPVSSKRKSHKPSPQKASNASKSSTKTTSSVAAESYEERPVKQGNSSLLDGSYDEEESAASFQQALAEWRGQAGKTSNEVQVYTTKDAEAVTLSSAGIQTGNVSAAKPNPQIQFSGKSGVTYFEHLIMKRHRYDPMFLSKASYSTKRRELEPSSVLNDRELPLDETATPSEFNIFYSPEEVIESPQNAMNDTFHEKFNQPTISSVADTVQITELEVGQLVHSARPKDVTINLSQPLTGQDHGGVKEENSVKMETKLNKTSCNARRAKSVDKKQRPGSRPKSKTCRPKSPEQSFTAPVGLELSNTEVEKSVRIAWKQCSTNQTKPLSQFFLQGVESGDNNTPITPKDITSKKGLCTMVRTVSLSSTIWLPGNSSTARTNEINPATDVPPLMFKPHPQTTPTHPHESQSESDDDYDSITELEASVSTIEDSDIWDSERRERDEEDDQALENLAWELASTIESEGRLTRCESEIHGEEGEVYTSTTPTPQLEGGDDITPHLTDLSQVMSEFELYMHQQTDMEQESD